MSRKEAWKNLKLIGVFTGWSLMPVTWKLLWSKVLWGEGL